MAKGNPNNEDMKLNFVPKVWDNKTKRYRPIYIAPDATDTKRGDVYLSDATDGTDNAKTGVTAATPAAVKAAMDNANDKVSKTAMSDQSIKSNLYPDETDTQNLGSEEKRWKDLYSKSVNTNTVTTTDITATTGNINGLISATGTITTLNSTKITAETGNIVTITATNVTADNIAGTLDGKFKTPREIKISNGDGAGASAMFDGSADIDLKLNDIDAATVKTGILPLSVVPQGALERLVKVPDEASRFELKKDNVQNGDSVYQIDEDVVFIVVDDEQLDNENGYQQYSSGTAKRLGVDEVGSKIKPVYFAGGVPVECNDYIGTLVVSRQKPEGEHILFWIEPEDKDLKN